MVLTVTGEQFQRMKAAVLDRDTAEALDILKDIVRLIEAAKNTGLKSHLDR